MKLPILALLLAAGLASPAVAQGAIGIVDRGVYRCELPGDAAGAPGIAQPALDFSIKNASRYVTPEGGGTYLRRGDVMTFTSGPRQGERYKVLSAHFLRRMDGDLPGRLRCVRAGKQVHSAPVDQS